MTTVTLLAWVLTGSAAAQSPDERIAQALSTIDAVVASSSPPGMVVAVTDRSVTRSVIVHGYADLNSKTPLTADSLFAIGSISKSFTSVALMELMDEGRFDPNEPIANYMPGFKVHSAWAPITGHQLLSHTAGLPNYLPALSSSRYAAYALREFQPRYAPGTHYWYSNTGFQVLGYVVENVEHEPYRSVIQRRVLTPLGMKASFAVIDDSLRSSLPTSYTRSDADGSYVAAPWFEYAAGDGSIISTGGDMCAYARMMLNRGMGPAGRMLSDPAFERLTKPNLDHYAYGLRVKEERGAMVIGHTGSIAGFNSSLKIHPQEGFAVAVLTNGPADPALWRWIDEVLEAAYRGNPLPSAPATPSASANPGVSYAGVYRAADGARLEFVPRPGGISLGGAGNSVPLSPMAPDTFRTSADDANAFPFIFARAERASGSAVIGVSHGSEWYTPTGDSATAPAATPPEFLAYVGHYENHNPEGPSVRIYVRAGQLIAAMEGEVSEDGAIPLERVKRGLFRPAEPSFNPETLQFDTLVEGRALRLMMTGTPLYRVDTQ